MVTVYQRCLANYQTRQWDIGTHVLFNETLKAEMAVTVPTPTCVPVPGYTCLGDCLLAARATAASPSACLNLFLTVAGTTSLDYFQYTPVPATSTHTKTPSSQIDACQVFTGPARLQDTGVPFQACLDHYSDTGACKIPLHVWSGRSSNRMPVATDHSKQVTNDIDRIESARNAYREIRDDVKTLLDSLNRSWTADDLSVSVFSAEGDALHQYLDCVMLGALDRVDLWPAPDPLPRPFWSRHTDGSPGRDFELPCSGTQLNDRLGVQDTQVCHHHLSSACGRGVRGGGVGGGLEGAGRPQVTHPTCNAEARDTNNDHR
jgi:hypothetical protein